ncbi:QRFP-like peptide receptor isoform X5 [Apis mellifera]|uniref:QRFP-like peptide receptor isoform X5 n=1 Tax=Apis mellifera TaxID=7460 RepID=A0A7M7MTV4_APIME|nr:QRFP-like peptide receptor isoform X5 [Apis mellifera]|eukprot:XP_026300933.1 QRFP-like peptide receptor isoform X5 [Apis mellifera]
MSNETNATDDFLDYDINDSLSHFDWAELGPVLVVYSLTFFLGLIGNVVIIGSTLCPRLRPLPATPTNVFLGGLATADLLLILFCIPVKVAKLFSYTWTMGLFLCKSVHYMQSVSAICSVVTLTAMSIERYYAIVHPMRAQYTCTISQARKIVITTWVASFLLGIPMIFTQTHKEVGLRVIAYWCVRDFEGGLLWRAHEVYMLVLVLVLPLAVMAYCYTAICWEIWRVMKRRYHMTSRRVLNPSNVDAESIPMTQRNSVRNNNRRSQREDSQTEEESRTIRQLHKSNRLRIYVETLQGEFFGRCLRQLVDLLPPKRVQGAGEEASEPKPDKDDQYKVDAKLLPRVQVSKLERQPSRSTPVN